MEKFTKSKKIPFNNCIHEYCKIADDDSVYNRVAGGLWTKYLGSSSRRGKEFLISRSENRTGNFRNTCMIIVPFKYFQCIEWMVIIYKISRTNFDIIISRCLNLFHINSIIGTIWYYELESILKFELFFSNELHICSCIIWCKNIWSLGITMLSLFKFQNKLKTKIQWK